MRWYSLAQKAPGPAPKEQPVVVQEPAANQRQVQKQKEDVERATDEDPSIDRGRMPVELRNRLRGKIPGPVMQRSRPLMNNPDFYRFYQDLGSTNWFNGANPRQLGNALLRNPLAPFKNDPNPSIKTRTPAPPSAAKATSPAASQPGPVAENDDVSHAAPTATSAWVAGNCRFAATELIDGWAAWCKKMGIGFDEFARGVDLLIQDREYYEREGWPALERAVRADEPARDMPGMDSLGNPIRRV